MSQKVKITKLAPSTNKGVTKVGFMYEFYDDRNLRHDGTGRFACLQGSEENFGHLIKQDLERRLGRSIDLELPAKYRPTLSVAR